VQSTRLGTAAVVSKQVAIVALLARGRIQMVIPAASPRAVAVAGRRIADRVSRVSAAPAEEAGPTFRARICAGFTVGSAANAKGTLVGIRGTAGVWITVLAGIGIIPVTALLDVHAVRITAEPDIPVLAVRWRSTRTTSASRDVTASAGQTRLKVARCRHVTA
jgi:hypothetical protein